MPRKMHPADVADRELIATATGFNVHLRRSPSDKINRPADTLAQAVAIADALRADHPGRDVLVYAITPTALSIPVPRDMQQAAREAAASKENTTMTTTLSTAEICALTASILGQPAKKAATKDAAAGRFVKVAAERGIPASDVLSMTFEAAQATIARVLSGEQPAIPNVKVEAETVPADAIPDFVPEFLRKDRVATMNAIADIKPQPEAKPAKQPKPAKAAPAPKAEGERKPRTSASHAEALEAAKRGELPTAPDFSAPTHKAFRGRLAKIVAMIDAGDVAGLKADTTEPKSSSRVILCRFRDLAITALEARRG